MFKSVININLDGTAQKKHMVMCNIPFSETNATFSLNITIDYIKLSL